MKRSNPFNINWSTMLIVFLIIGIFANYRLMRAFETRTRISDNTPVLQVALILKDSQDSFWKQFKEGADKAAGLYKMSLDVSYLEEMGQNKSDFTDTELIEKASVARADGIVSYISTLQGKSDVIDQAAHQKIPVLTLENDVPDSKRSSFVGYNAYQFGQEAGKKMIEVLAGKGKIAIIMSQTEVADSNAQNLKISGFLNEINKSPDLEVVEYVVSGKGVEGTQNVLQSLRNKQSAVQGLFITNSIDTESIGQSLIEYNLVGEYQVIGSGNSDIIKNYLDKSILYASVYVNAYEMGYRSVETIAKIKNNQPVPSYIDTAIGVLTSKTPGPESR